MTTLDLFLVSRSLGGKSSSKSSAPSSNPYAISDDSEGENALAGVAIDIPSTPPSAATRRGYGGSGGGGPVGCPPDGKVGTGLAYSNGNEEDRLFSPAATLKPPSASSRYYASPVPEYPLPRPHSGSVSSPVVNDRK